MAMPQRYDPPTPRLHPTRSALRRKIISITGVLLVNGMAESERKAKALAAKYEAELAPRKCANGTIVFEVNYDAKYIEAVLAFKASKRLAARAYSISARR